MRPGDAERLLEGLLGLPTEVGFAGYDRDHRYLAINVTLAAANRTPVAEHIGRRPEDVLEPAVAAYVNRMIDQVFATGEPAHVDEPSTPGRDGRAHLRASWYPVLPPAAGATPAVAAWVAVFVVDDTTLREVSDALRDSQARSARLFDVADELARAVTVEEVARAVTSIGRRILGADWSAVALLGDDGIRLVGTDGNADPAATDGAATSPDWPGDAVAAVADVVQSGRPVFLSSREDGSWAVLPLIGSSGRLGALRFGFRQKQSFDLDLRLFLRAIAQQCGVTVERARLFEQERTAAASLTRGLLPPRLPGVSGLELGARSWPGEGGKVVGGDWYDAFVLPGGEVSLVLGDVMGHGLSAAAGMTQLRAALRALALADPDPGAVLAGLDRLVDNAGTVEMATVVYAVLDPSTGRARFGDAGHLPLVHVPVEGPCELVHAGPETTPIGVPEARAGRDVWLQPGAVVLGFTDGVVESRTRPLDAGLAQLLACLNRVRGQPLEVILDTVDATMHEPGSADERTILGLRWTGT